LTYKEPLLLFRQENRRVVNISAEAGPVFQRQYAARGMALGDYDNDGRYDVLVANNGRAPLLLHHWLGIRLAGTQSNRDAIGDCFNWSVGGVQHLRLIMRTSGDSYFARSPRDPGIGQSDELDWLEGHQRVIRDFRSEFASVRQI